MNTGPMPVLDKNTARPATPAELPTKLTSTEPMAREHSPVRAKTPPLAPHELFEKTVGPLMTRAESTGFCRGSEKCESTTPPSALASLRENSVSPIQLTVEPFSMYTTPPFMAELEELCSLFPLGDVRVGHVHHAAEGGHVLTDEPSCTSAASGEARARLRADSATSVRGVADEISTPDPRNIGVPGDQASSFMRSIVVEERRPASAPGHARSVESAHRPAILAGEIVGE